MIKLLRKIKEFVDGTFVADCPRCHKHYYGHQGHIQQVKAVGQEGKLIHYRYLCYRCMKDEYKAM